MTNWDKCDKCIHERVCNQTEYYLEHTDEECAEYKEIIDNAPTMPLQDAIHNYLLAHTTSELLEVVLEAVKEYER